MKPSFLRNNLLQLSSSTMPRHNRLYHFFSTTITKYGSRSQYAGFFLTNFLTILRTALSLTLAPLPDSLRFTS